MKFKKRRGTEAPPKARAFINNVVSVPLENIELPLKTFIWEYEKGDFNHWVELFNHFDSFFEKYVKPRKDLQLDDDFEEADVSFPREAILQVLRVSRTILENCTNKHFYCSYEQHLSSLLASSDADVVIASLQTLAAFVKKPVGKCSIRDAALNAKLFALSQGWGGKEEGLGLLACSTENGPDPVGYRLGSALHFEFYVDESVKKGDSAEEEPRPSGLQVIHITDMSMPPESDIQLLKHLIDEYKVPSGLRFSLLTRLRFARSFSCLDTRRQYICIRLLAFTVLVQASNDTNDLAAFFTNEPEFVNELVSLVRFDDVVPEDIRILAILALGALYQDRSRQTTVLNVITSGGHRGILPSLMQKAIGSISSGAADCSISFLEALLSLITVLVSSSSGCTALRDVGLMPTLLPLLKDLNPQHIHLVTASVHVLEAFMDYSNPAAISFRDLGGLDNTIARLKLEVCRVEEGASKPMPESQLHGKGKSPLNDTGASEAAQTSQSETLVPYHRRLLMKALLRAISLGTYAPGNTARLYGSEESALPFCLCAIFKRAKDFGGGVFSLAATVMSDLIHKDPTCYSVLDSAGLPNAFLDAIMAGVLPSAEAVSCIPQCLDALCLNNLGLQAISERGALKCFVKIFTSKIYLRALANDTPGSLSTALDELMRHAASLRGPGVDVLIEILNTIAKIGSSIETPSFLQDSASTSAPVPMETDLEERVACSVDGEESSTSTPEQVADMSAEISNSNMEAFLPDCISNATRLLENILHNTDTCGVFIEKKGIEAVLQLFDLPLLPLSFASGQNIAVAFKNFSPQHSSPLTRAVCTALREHLKPALELADSLAGTKLADVEGSERTRILRCLSSLEGVLSFSTHLLKSTTTMMPELGSGDADILKEVGKVYKVVLWQISLVNDARVDAKKEAEQGATTSNAAANASGSEVASDAGTVSVVRYVNPVSMRNGPASGWGIDPEFLSVIQSGEGLHRHSRRDHGIDGISRMRLGRLGRQADVSDIEIGGSVNAAETSQSQDPKRKSPDFLDFETMNKVATAMRSFYVNLVKVLVVPNRRRDDTGSLSGAAKSVVVSLAKVFDESLLVDESCTFSEFELALSTKCRYLGKVVDDIAAVIYDNRRRMCNTAVVNYFYSHGTIQKLLKTFEATGQLLWTVPLMSQPGKETENEKENENDKIEHASWLLETLRSYCKLLEHLVTSTLLLTTNSASQLLVQPVVGASFHVPRDPEVFVRTIQAQVLCSVLPVWNHPMFSHCSPSLITSVVSIISHVYSGIGDAKGSRNGIPGSGGQRFRGHPPDETSISMIVDMGFPRSRAEEALRRVETNSVEMAMEWLFSHPEEPAQEDDELAQALALSLGKSSEASKEEASEKGKEVLIEEKLPENPPVEDILATCMNLLQSTDAIAFPMTDLIVTLCCQNKGQYRPRVVSYLVQHLKLCKVDGSERDSSPVSTISHLLALVLSEDSSAREVAAENGLACIALELLTNFAPKNVSGEKVSVPKWVTALLLVLDHMLQCKLQFTSDPQNTVGTGSHANAPEDISAGIGTVNDSHKSALDENIKDSSPFMGILGKPSGYMTIDEQHKAMNIACDYLQLHLPATTVQSVLQLCARLTKSHSMAIKFLERGGLSSLLSLPRSCFFPGFDSVAAAIIRHLLEDPQTLQIAMEVEIRQTLINILNRHGGRVSPRTFLTSMAPVISREPTIFMQAAAVVCQLETVGGRPNIILSKEKEDKEKGKEKEKMKEKDKEKEKEKAKTSFNTEACVASGDIGRVHDGICRPHDGLGKPPKGHKKIPHSFTQVIDQLLEVILHYPPPSQGEECTGSTMAMEVDEVAPKEKGKAKIEDALKSESDNFPDGSAGLAKVAFILKLMSDILLMYIHAAGVVLRRDSESSQGRGPCQGADASGHGGLLYHVLHRLLPYPVDKTSENNSEEWREKLSEKASWFLVVICGRSGEGRKRVISEIVRALNMASNSVKGSSKHVQLPNKKVLAFVELVNSILSNNASSGNTQVSGCSPDMAKTMIDTAMVQALTSTLQVIDLDHPDAPKLVNLILKALEALTRAASTGEQVYKSDDGDKKSILAADDRNHGGTNRVTSGEVAQVEQNEISQGAEQHATGLGQHQIQIAEGSADRASDQAGNVNEHMEHDMRIEREETPEAHDAAVHGEEFIRGTVEVTTDLHNSTTEVSFRVEHRADDEMGDEDDDEDMDDDVEEEDEDEDEDEEDDIEGEEGAAHMSLADTDVEDHEDNGLGDDYGDDMVGEEDDDDFPENRVIEVRWREGLDGLNHVQVLGHAGGGGNLVDLSAEPFQGIHMEDIFGLRRPAGVDRRRPTGHRPFPERPGIDRGGAFQHPLLTRPAQSGGVASNGSIWAASGNISRDSATISGGSFDVAQFFMYDAPMLLPQEHPGGSFFGDRGVGGPPPLLDFSMDPIFVTGRRGPGNGRWTDDGQPQAGAQAAAIAQAVEEEFLAHLRSLTQSVDESPSLQAVVPSTDNVDGGQQTTVAVMDTDVQTSLPPGNLSGQQIEEHQMGEAEISQVHPNASLEHNEQREPVFDVEGNRDDTDVMMRDEGNEAGTRDIESESQDSEGSGATMGESLRSLEVETGSADGREETERQGGNQTLTVSTTDISDARASGMDEENINSELRGANLVVQVQDTDVDQNHITDETSVHLQAQDEATQAGNNESAERSSEETRTNTIDPTFLEALPEDLRAEVLASQQVQSTRAANYTPPPAEDIDPEFLAALPPDIQAEVLAQQRAQRVVQSQQAEGRPVDMDSASIIATFPAELREEVLLTSSEAVLAALSPALLAEAQMLRERAMSQYQHRSFLGAGHRLGGRRQNIGTGGQASMERGVGNSVGLTLGRRPGTSLGNAIKMKEVEGKALVDTDALKALLQLLRLAQPLGKGLLQRLLLNLCTHSATRVTLVNLLLDMLRPEAEGLSVRSNGIPSQRLYGCQWNVVYARSQLSDGVPPLVSRRVLEILTYLAKNHFCVADLLFYTESCPTLEAASQTSVISNGEKGKGKVVDEVYGSHSSEGTEGGDIPLILLLKLLNQPLFSRSSAHLEQLMGLLEVVMNNVGIKSELEASASQPKDAATQAEGGYVGSESLPEIGSSVALATQMGEPASVESNDDSKLSGSSDVAKTPEGQEASASGLKKEMDASEVLLQLPQRELQNLCKLLAKEGLSDTVYAKVAEVLKKLASIAPTHRKLFISELADAAHCLSGDAVAELGTFQDMELLGGNACSMAGASILRVLQAMSTLTSDVGTGVAEEKEHESLSVVGELNMALDPLWQGLSVCISKIEQSLGNTSDVSSSAGRNAAATSVASPLPPGTQRVLPFIEAFFVLCEKLQLVTTSVQHDPDDASTSDAAQPRKAEGGMTFVKFSDKHRRLLNAFVRQQPGLLEKSLSLMLKTPRLIDFDNKRSFFRSRIRQQNEQHNYNPHRICVRRTYVLEDSYNQLRMRSVDEIKGRLTVQFQGEEGIDAGGLTREWYQLLSRVIFDKGALLFTTVGNESTFQPNPNSVYQTEHLSYFKFVGRVVAKALFDGQLLDVHFTRSFYKHILGVKVTYHDIEAIDPDYFKNLKWMLENDISDILDLTFSMDADEEKRILYEKTEVTDHELISGGRNIRVTEENKHQYVDLVAEHILTNAIRSQINAFMEGFNELIPKHLISIFNDKELELLISGLPEIDLDDLKSSTEYTGYTSASPVIQWFWEAVQGFGKEDMARLLQFVTGTSKVPLEGFKALQGISGPQRFQIHKAYGAPERLPSAHTCFNQLDLPEYSSKDQLQERLLLAIHEASEGFGFG